MITDRINFRQPKYVLPAILYPLLLVTGYLVMDIFDTEVAETPSALQTTEYLNPELPEAQMRDDGIGGKYESMVKSYGRIQDYSAVENIERNNNETAKEDYDSRYSDEDLALLDSEAAARSEELEHLREMQERLRQSAERGEAMVADSTGVQPLSEEERLARSEQRRKEALAELDKALAEARKQGQKGLQDVDSTDAESLAPTGSVAIGGKVEINEQAVNELAENAESEQVVKKVKTSSDYFNTLAENDFNTLAENEPEPRLIKAIIDENIKAVEGSRVRLRLLDDVEIDGKVVPKGSYLYATMSGFGSQRVKGSIKSLLVEDELVKVNLSLYDTDGLEGLYVPSSSFRETTQDVASNALGSTMSINNGSTGNTFAQWGMQAIQNAYQRTSNALSKAVRKNKAKLKYGTFVYLVNGREKRN